MSLMPRVFGPDRKAAARPRRKIARPLCRPMVEDMESRLVLNAPGAAASVMPPPAQVAAQAQPAVSVPLTITGINLTSITQLADGTIQAVGTITGTLLGHAFTTDLTALIPPTPAGQTCPVLDLQLAPIHLNVLGLHVDTSAICLDITAHSGGGLLGDLLCGTNGLLDNLLADINGALGAVLNGGVLDLSTVLGDLNDILGNTQLLGGLNQLLGTATSSFGSPAVSGPGCTILDLSLGPVDLNLLGLEVSLDNCANGPVTVTITAQPGGGLLGDLLCSLDNLLTNGHASTNAIDRLLGNIVRIIENA